MYKNMITKDNIDEREYVLIFNKYNEHYNKNNK